MPKLHSQGFTIIEVMLFLAVSGLMLIVAFTGVRGRNASAQFTDSMRSLQSFIQKTQTDLYNGVNLRSDGQNCTIDASGNFSISGSTNRGKSNCIMLGRLLEFTPNSSSVSVHSVVGRYLSYDDLSKVSGGDLDYIIASNPHIYSAPNLDSNYDIRWGTKFIKTNKPNQAGAISFVSKTLAFLRSPAATTTYNVDFADTTSFASNSPVNVSSSAVGSFAFGSDVDVHYCFKGTNGQDAEIIVGGSASDSIELQFDTGCAP